MDNTFLGALLLLKREPERRPEGRFALVAPTAECVQLLEQMGLADVLRIAGEADMAGECWTALCSELHDPEAFQRNVV